MGIFTRFLLDHIDDKANEIIGKKHKEGLTVHNVQFPAYRFVDIYNAIEKYTSHRDDLVVIETEQSEGLNDILHSQEESWTDRSIAKSSKRSWPISASDEAYLPIDGFWFCPSLNHGHRFIVRLKFDENQQKTELEIACGDSAIGKHHLDEIARISSEDSIFRNQILHLAYEPGKDDEYGDVEKAEHLQVLFSKTKPVTEQDIVLSDEHMQLLQRNIIDLHERREFLKNNGVPTSRGILLHGPPGTGKTFACRYICNKLKCATAIFSTGAALANVGALFSLARLLQPAVLFIEDADLMFSSREYNLHSTTLGELMDQMDGLRSKEDISVVFTTNDIDRMEAALKDRPGRISQCIYMGAPDDGLRKRYIEHLLVRFDLEDLDVKALVRKSEGSTQAFIKEWLNRSIQIACERLSNVNDSAIPTDIDFSRAMDEMNQSLSESGKNIIGFTAGIK